MTEPKIGIHFGCLAEPIKKQLNDQGFILESKDEEYLQKIADAINFLKFGYITGSVVQCYDRMLEINSKENMQKIWEANQNNKQIRWKDSVQKLLGISQTGELIKTRTACGNI